MFHLKFLTILCSWLIWQVFGLSLGTGLAKPLGADQTIPLSDRYYFDGRINAMRGYKNYSLGPQGTGLVFQQSPCLPVAKVTTRTLEFALSSRNFWCMLLFVFFSLGCALGGNGYVLGGAHLFTPLPFLRHNVFSNNLRVHAWANAGSLVNVDLESSGNWFSSKVQNMYGVSKYTVM